MFTVKDFHYEPASEEVITRVKRGAIPKNHSYVRGGNGTFAVKDDAQVILRFENESGKIVITDIAPELRGIAKLKGKNLTKNRADYVGGHLKGYESKDGNVDRETLESLFQNSLH